MIQFSLIQRARIIPLFALLILFGTHAFAAEKIPPVPTRYFNDYANVISAPAEQELNSKLEQFEKDSSSQVVVAIYPKMESDDAIESYTVRVARAWKVGQKEKRNGAVLFVFIADRKMFLQIGYGLEGAIPDAIAKEITEFEIKPHFKTGNYDAGLRAGVNAIIQAARGEYKGTGRTVNQRNRQDRAGLAIFIFFIVFFLIIASTSRRRRGRVYRRSGWGPVTWGGGNWGGGSWGGGGGGRSSGGGGGFSSGGGSFGGGGASSSW